MGLRSRALLTGVATGFLKANNDRRSRMQERMQELADNRAQMDRERAKSRYDAAVKGAAEENSVYHSLRSAEHLNANDEYTDLYWKDKTLADWRANGNGMTHEQFIETFKQGRGKKFQRQYKDMSVIEQDVSKVYDSINAKHFDESNMPVLTGVDRMLGGGFIAAKNTVAKGFNAATSAIGVDAKMQETPMSTLEPQAPKETATPEFNPMAAQGPVETYEDQGFQYAMPGSESQKAHKFVEGADGKITVVFADSEKGVTKFDTGLLAGGEGSGASSREPTIKDIQEKRYLNGVPISNVVEFSYLNENGLRRIQEGVMKEGKFVPLEGLSPFEDITPPKEEAQGPYEGDYNVKQAQLAQDVLYSSVRGTKTLANIKALVNPSDYGSEKVVSDLGNSMTALFRVTNIGFKGGIAEKDRVLEAMSKGAAFNDMAPEVQAAILNKDYKSLKVLTKAYNDAEMQGVFDAFGATATDEKDEEILSELRASSISAEMQPLVRDLLRAWTGGDKKPAWGAAEHLLETLKAGSTPEKLLAQVDVYERDMARTTMSNLQIKWDRSRYSMSNDIAAQFLDDDIGDFPATEYRRDRRTGHYLMIKTGRNSEGDVVRYFVPTNSMSVYEVKIPSKDKKMSDKDHRTFKYANRLVDQYTEVLNVHGRPIN